MTDDNRTTKPFLIGLCFFVLLGALLRLWNLPSQVLLDDEWHALNFVIGKSFTDMFVQQGMGANSIPVNIYTWLVLHTVGWSELLLRVPSVLAGIATVAVLPLLARRLWGGTVAMIAAALLAVAPTLIFYSRVARPYGPVMLFGAAATLLTLLWVRSGRRRDLLLAALTGSVAIYYHLYATIPVGIPLGLCFLCALYRPTARLLASSTPVRDLLIAGGVLAAIVGVAVVIPNLLHPWWMSGGIHGKDYATLKTGRDLLSLIAGSPQPFCFLLVGGLAVGGVLLLIIRTRLEGMLFIAPFILFAIIAMKTSQEGSQAAIQVARYGITLVALWYLTVAIAVERLLGGLLRSSGPGRHWLGRAVLCLAWLPFLLTSPLWEIYRLPNNFMNHSAFQYHYEPHTWERSRERDLAAGYSMRQQDIPRYYFSDRIKSVAGIIEYPMMIGDHFNLYHYYQHFHQRPVRVGYFPNVANGWQYDKFVRGNVPVDDVISRLSPQLQSACDWRAMVDITDLANMRQHFGGWLLILHRNPMAEAFPHIIDSHDYQFGDAFIAGLHKSFGPPAFMDAQVAGWVIR
jgi:4-amino-4-deoxy-L-arabinose transferase-like glycosyltransferase